MSTDRFHKAAKDGMIEVLKEATKRDCNGRDEQGMTPTLYAAFHGNLEALRLLCGRGGDPDKADLFGNTALHLAAAQGHKHIVTFLVNFGANIYSTDIDGRTAQELAGMNNRDDILRFLDGVHAKLEAGDKKKTKTLRDKAKKDSEKCIKKFNKRQVKKEKDQEKLEQRKIKAPRPSVIETLKTRIKSGSMTNLANLGPAPPRNSFSAIVGNGTVSGARNMGSVQRRILAGRTSRATFDDDFKISEIEDGQRSVRSLKGYRRDSEVLYAGTIDSKAGQRLESVFNKDEYIVESPPPPPSNGLTRSISQPDFMHELETNGDKMHQEPASIFVRPGIGSLAFRKSITNTFQGFYGGDGTNEESSIGSGESYGLRTNNLSTEDELSESESSEDENPNGPLERFLTAFGLGEYLPRFEEQKIDLVTLMMLSENDLKTLGLPLGPHIRLVKAINDRKAALENPGEVVDSML
ncbi:pre-mRNA splicing regulator USH1G [Zophobas morio]|uniref:pre-mRNA splicing regulator USH1G n=1 Tax=Zophobas morio TaxID=2755281 RepID=UPI003083037A